MTPEEIARRLVDDWWKGLGALAGKTQITSERAITLATAIASAIRAERERAEAREEVASEWKYLADRRANLIDEIAAERDRLREALERIKGNQVRAHHDFRIDACHIASEALARVKGESNG